MGDNTSRILRLIALLQRRRFWAGDELAERLDVTARTLRRDVERLRQLGYVVSSTSGPGGGYQLGRGESLPLLALDDREAVTLAAALRSAIDHFSGSTETVLGLLAKLDELLPTRARQEVSALQHSTMSLGDANDRVDATTLTQIAVAIERAQIIYFSYLDHSAQRSKREVEPLRIVHVGRHRWYLIAWDRNRNDFRTFRVDRIEGNIERAGSFSPRIPPGGFEEYIKQSIRHAPSQWSCRARLYASYTSLTAKRFVWCGTVTKIDEESCELRCSANRLEEIVCQLLLAGVAFEILEAPEQLLDTMHSVAMRLQDAAHHTKLAGSSTALDASSKSEKA